jgi:hypothetical protein
LDSARRLLQSGLVLSERPEEKKQFLNQMLELSNEIEKILLPMTKRFQNSFEPAKLGEFRLQITIELAKLKKTEKNPAPK